MRTVTRISTTSISRLADVPDKVSGIAYSSAEKAVAFFCFETGDIGFIDGNGIRFVPRRLEVPSPMGMAGDQFGMALLQPSQRMLWRFDQSFSRGSCAHGKKVYKDLLSHVAFARRSRAVPVPLCRNMEKSIIMAFPKDNKVVMASTTSAKPIMGCGRRGFSMSNDPAMSMMDGPAGVAFDTATRTLFVSDSGNGVVRSIRDGMELPPMGMPGDLRQADGEVASARFSRPSAIAIMGRKMAIVDGRMVRVVDRDAKSVATPYVSSREILGVAAGGGDIFVLEEA